MIRITCTHCRQLLTIDDGFAGGVCRCQHCGTIQTVPAAPGKSEGRGSVPAAKTLYRAEARKSDSHVGEAHAPSGSGLDQLAEIVSSSGLTHSARAGRPSSANGDATIPSQQKKRTPVLLTVAVVVILALIGVIIALWHAQSKTAAPPESNNQPVQTPSAPAPPPVAVTGPSFCGVPITAPDTVVYLLDNGQSAGDTLPALKTACLQSLKSLGPEKRFKVVFWRPDGPVYPQNDSVRATDAEIANCKTAIDDVYAQGNTDVDAPMKLAMTARPDAIVLVTAKAAELPDDFVNTVMTDRADASTKIYAFGINGDSSSDPAKPGILATLAAKSGGQYVNLSSDMTPLPH